MGDIVSIGDVICLLEESPCPREDVKIALAILRDIQREMAECAAVVNANKTLNHVFWMRDGKRTVAQVLLARSAEKSSPPAKR